MYLGLQTFNTQSECTTSLSGSQCVQQGNMCCKGTNCVASNVTCANGTTPVSNGCDSNCQPQVSCQPSTAKSITITSPNGSTSSSGGEAWIFGQTYDIKWNSNGVNKVNISLEFYGGGGISIANGISASLGKYIWTVDAMGNNSSYHKIIITDADSSNTTDKSDNYFIILSAPITKSITVTSPNGGEQWVPGTTHDITWNSSGVDRVNVYVLDENDHSSFIACPQVMSGCDFWGIPPMHCTNYKGIASNIDASLEKYSWTIPSTINLSDGYKIIIESTSCDGKNFYSDSSNSTFSIASQIIATSSSVKLIYPNGGETFTQGSNMNISWSGGSAKVLVGLVKDTFNGTTDMNILGWIHRFANPDSFLIWDGKSVSDTSGATTWDPLSVYKGPFKIIVVSEDSNGNYIAGNSGNYDTSDNYFNIYPNTDFLELQANVLNSTQNQLASIASAITQLIEKIKGLIK
jgi:hypothetical protein